MPRKLFTAILRSASGVSSVDPEAGIIRGVKLMQLGKLARFAGEEGKAKQVTITSDHISALLSHAGNRSIPIHDSHEWFDAQDKPNADSVEMNARIGALKAFRRDDAGNLIADAHLNKAKPAALDLLWGAEANPEDNCFSVVFNYLKDDPNCIPQNFRAGDRVPNGAATTALFSEDNNPTAKMAMTLDDIKEVLSTPEGEAYLNGILKAHGKMKSDAEDDTAAAAMESDAGVSDADKKPEDDQKPALMRAYIRCSRAFARERKSLSTERAALLSEVDTKIEAAKTSAIGAGKFLGTPGGKFEEDATAKFNAHVKELTDKKVPLATATMSVISAHPEIYNEMNTALFRPAKQL